MSLNMNIVFSRVALKKIFSSGALFPINSDEKVKDFPGNSIENKGIILLIIEFILCSRPSVKDFTYTISKFHNYSMS